MKTVSKRPFNHPYDKRDADILAVMLNGLRVRFPRKYARLARIMDEFDAITFDKPIDYNQFSDEQERLWFESNPRSMLIDNELIFATDREKARALAVDRLNGRLEKYRCYPVVDIRLRGHWKGRWSVQWESPKSEADVVHRIVQLVESDLLKRVRQCQQCGDWFYASRSKKRFCKKACSKQHWNTSPDGKASRRPYMREYMKKRRKMEKEELLRRVRGRSNGNL